MTIADDMRTLAEKEFDLGTDSRMRPWAIDRTTGDKIPLPGDMVHRLVGLYAMTGKVPDQRHAQRVIDVLVMTAQRNGRLAAITGDDEAKAFPSADPPALPTDKPAAKFNSPVDGERELLGHIGKRDDIFRSNGSLVWVRKGDDDRDVLRSFDKPATFAQWANRTHYVYVIDQTDAGPRHREILLPLEVAHRIIAAEIWPGICSVRSISRIPVVRRDGSLMTANGYDPGTRVWFDIDGDLVGLTVPAAPTRAEIEAALAVLLGVLSGFPFVEQADRANALALQLTPQMQALLDDARIPLHGVHAPGGAQGTGKTIIGIEMPGLMAGGYTEVTYDTDDVEMRKLLTSTLMRSSAKVLGLDNVDPRDLFESPVLAKAATRGWHEDRILGGNTMASMPFDRITVVTGNGLRIGPDMVDRMVPIRLDPRMPNPKARQFAVRLDDAQVLAGLRRDLITAALTIVRGWVLAGMPEATTAAPMRQFSRWASMLGGLLEWLGVDGFLGNLDAFTESDPKVEAAGFLIERLGGVMPAGGFTTDDVVDAIATHPQWDDDLPSGIGEVIEREVLGAHDLQPWSRAKVKAKVQYRLRDESGVWHGSRRLVRDRTGHGGAVVWRIENSRQSRTGDDGDDGDDPLTSATRAISAHTDTCARRFCRRTAGDIVTILTILTIEPRSLPAAAT